MIPEGQLREALLLPNTGVRCKRTGLRRGWRLYVKARVNRSAVKVMSPHFSSGQDCRRSSRSGWVGSMKLDGQRCVRFLKAALPAEFRNVWPGHPCVFSGVPNEHSSSPIVCQCSLSLVLSDNQSTLLPTSLCGGATAG